MDCRSVPPKRFARRGIYALQQCEALSEESFLIGRALRKSVALCFQQSTTFLEK